MIKEADTSDPFELIPLVLSAAKDFDCKAANAIPPFEKDKWAVFHGGGFALWAWSFGKGKIPAIHYTVRTDDELMESIRKERISKCITPSLLDEEPQVSSSGISEEVMRNIAVSIANQNEEFALSRQLREEELAAKIEKEESKKNKIKDLHSAVLNMLLNASATNSEEKPHDLPNS